MHNKKVYDYLAQVYFGKKETRQKDLVFKFLLSTNLILLLILLVLLFNPPARFFFVSVQKIFRPKGTYFEISGSYFPLRFEYDFSLNSPDILSLNLRVPPMNVKDFDFIRIVLKGENLVSSEGIMGIELKNIYDERDFVYIYGIGKRWKYFDIPLNSFSRIKDFSQIDTISFRLERWNAPAKEGIFFIDKVFFLKEGGKA